MKCSNCGSEQPDDVVFCNKCGSRLNGYDEQGSNEQGINNPSAVQNDTAKQYCGKCGAELYEDDIFCRKCGQAVIADISAPSGKRGKPSIAVVIIIAMAVIIAALAGVIIAYIGGGNNAAEPSAAPAAETVEPTETPGATFAAGTIEQNAQGTVPPGNTQRTDLYSSSLTYKRMSEIHNTVLSNDAVFEELKDVILDFNKQCDDYMNGITSAVPTYLREGTTAYDQQVEHKNVHPSLQETYLETDVINAREGGGYYYVWVTEVISVIENDTSSIQEEHWVYKLEKINGLWYINDYTRDPLYN